MGLGLLSRWPILTAERRELPNKQRGGSTPYALQATLDHPRGPLHVIVSGTEWEPGSPTTTSPSAAGWPPWPPTERLDGRLPVLLLADLNAAADMAELEPLLATMVDTWAEGGADPAAVTLDASIPYAPVGRGQADRPADRPRVGPSRAARAPGDRLRCLPGR